MSAFHIDLEEPLEVALRRLLLGQADKICHDLQQRDRIEAIHNARKCCKRIRALLRLLKPAMPDFCRRENKDYRDLARPLSSLRDRDARKECFNKLVELDPAGPRHYRPVRSLLERDRRGWNRRGRSQQISRGEKSARTARQRLEALPLPSGRGFKLIREGLQRSYRQGRKAMKQAYRLDEDSAFHKWRKRAKDMNYQVQILIPLWPRVLKHLYKELNKLGDCLGDEHDLVMLRKAIMRGPNEKVPQELLRSFLGLVEQRIRELKIKARKTGHRIYAESTGAFIKRMKTYWNVSLTKNNHI
ncbi:MAG: CHAD domain-containing protein [Methylacidiphilales bacterium]|nr:CHAD domain-containing protein [Candidatus Methylacidiphilales bacterium]